MFFTTQYIASKLQIINFFTGFMTKIPYLIQPFPFYLDNFLLSIFHTLKNLFIKFLCVSLSFQIHSLDQQA